jgi:hypothetical protein
MSISISGKIVTNGLVIHLDALNPRSYPGSGATWYDLTSYNNTGSLFNNPTIANGYISCSGYDNTERVVINDINEIGSTTEYVTVDMWAKLKNPPNTEGVSGMFCGFDSAYSIHLRPVDDVLGFTSGTNDIYGIDTVTELGLVDNWKHYCFVMIDQLHYPSLTLDDQKIYINGQSQALSQQLGTTGTPYFSFSNPFSSLSLPGRTYTGGNTLLLNMDIALVKIYNRQLTQAEVTQNFNAHKGRFNIY